MVNVPDDLLRRTREHLAMRTLSPERLAAAAALLAELPDPDALVQPSPWTGSYVHDVSRALAAGLAHPALCARCGHAWHGPQYGVQCGVQYGVRPARCTADLDDVAAVCGCLGE